MDKGLYFFLSLNKYCAQHYHCLLITICEFLHCVLMIYTLAHKNKASHGTSPVTPPWKGGGSIPKKAVKSAKLKTPSPSKSYICKFSL